MIEMTASTKTNQSGSTLAGFRAWVLPCIRVGVGILFIFSGLVKLNDPLGFSYKLEEYFDVFGLAPLMPFALFLSIFFCTLEVVLGAAALVGYKPRWIIPMLLALILFFTFLTFYSAYFHKVTECGCFGDAVKMTPWQSVEKNLLLTALIGVLLVFKSSIRPLGSAQQAGYIVLSSLVLALGFGLYTYLFLPVMDFLPYKIGNYLPALIDLPPGSEGDQFKVEISLRNKKTGDIKVLDNKEYIRSRIYENPDWVFIHSSEPILTKEGYQVPAKDFKVTDKNGNDQTHSILTKPGYTLIVVEYHLSPKDSGVELRLQALAASLAPRGVITIGLTSETVEEAGQVLAAYKRRFPTYFCDAIPLKSMVRSSPGLVLLRAGTVVGKWSVAGLPGPENILQIMGAAHHQTSLKTQ